MSKIKMSDMMWAAADHVIATGASVGIAIDRMDLYENHATELAIIVSFTKDIVNKNKNIKLEVINE